MSYCNHPCIPQDLWYTIAQFIPYELYNVVENRLFIDDNSILYKEEYQRTIGNRRLNKGENYRSNIEKISLMVASNYSQRLLEYAAEEGHIVLVKKAIEQGADISFYDYGACQLAARYGHIDVLAFLLQQKPEAIQNDNYKVLYLAIIGDQYQTLNFLINAYPQLITMCNYAAVHWAYNYRRFDMTKLIIEKDPTCIASRKHELLINAINDKNVDIVRFMVEKDRNCICFENYYPLIVAIRERCLEIIKLFVKMDPACLHAVPITWPKTEADEEILQYFISKGVPIEYYPKERWDWK